MKIVINNDYGGYALSEAAYQELGLKWDGYGFANNIKRNDPRLVACVEKLGPLASGSLASLIVVEIPDDVEWEVQGYDGSEWIAEKHRTWP